MNWIRKNSRTIILLTVAAFVATIFFQWGMNYLGQQGGQRHIATVAGEEIPLQEFQRRLQQRQKQFRSQNSTSITPQTLNRLRRETFRQMVNEIILQNYLQKHGIPASDAHVRAYIRQRYFTSPQGEFNQQGWQRFLSRASAQEKTRLEQNQREQIETTRMQEWLASQVQLSQTEIDQLLRTGLREVRLRGIYLDPAEYINSERIRDYYLGNDEQFQAPPRALVEEIFFDIGDTTPQQNQQKLQQLREDLEVIQRRFDAGDSFSKLAQEFSEKTETGPRWVEPNDLNSRSARTIFRMEKNQLSNLVKSDSGYHLYHIKKGPVQEKKPLPAVRNQIVNRLLSDTHWKQAKSQAEQLYNQISRSNNPPETLQEMAHSYSDGQSASNGGNYGWVPARFIVPSLHAESDSDVWRGEISNRFIVNSTISNAVFSTEAGTITNPVRSDYGYHILSPLEFRNARLDQLSEEDRQLITQLLRREKSSHFLREWLAKKREETSIELQVPESQIGGSLEDF